METVRTGEKSVIFILQQQFDEYVRETRRLAKEVFGDTSRGSFDEISKRNELTPLKGRPAYSEMVRLVKDNFSRLYSQIPTGHHLIIEVAPSEYSSLKDSKEFAPFCEFEKGDAGPKYFLHIGKPLNRNVAVRRKTISTKAYRQFLTMEAVGGVLDERFGGPQIRHQFSLETIARRGSNHFSLDGNLYPEDILAIRVVRDKDDSKFIFNGTFYNTSPVSGS